MNVGCSHKFSLPLSSDNNNNSGYIEDHNFLNYDVKVNRKQWKNFILFFLWRNAQWFCGLSLYLDADLSCGKENRELYGDFWNPNKFFWLCYHPLQFESSLIREQHGLRIDKSIGYRILNTSYLLLSLGHQPYFYNFIRLCFKNIIAVWADGFDTSL
jgi:hypothetical protein